MWIDCGIHAREWISPAFCLWFVQYVSTFDLVSMGYISIRSVSQWFFSLKSVKPCPFSHSPWVFTLSTQTSLPFWTTWMFMSCLWWTLMDTITHGQQWECTKQDTCEGGDLKWIHDFFSVTVHFNCLSQNRMWRKNRSVSNNCIGVDLNRNFDANWCSKCPSHHFQYVFHNLLNFFPVFWKHWKFTKKMISVFWRCFPCYALSLFYNITCIHFITLYYSLLMNALNSASSLVYHLIIYDCSVYTI